MERQEIDARRRGSRWARGRRTPTIVSVTYFPDSSIARDAEQLLRDTSPEHLVNHCLRSFVWADQLAQLEGVPFDAEVLFVAAALHDLGLVADFDTGLPFEVDGARAAADHLIGWGWPRPRAGAVADAVELHMAPELPDPPEPEAYLLWHATTVDVSGSRFEEMPEAVVRRTLARFPRLGFAAGFGELFADQARRKPGTRVAEAVDGGILGRIALHPLELEEARRRRPSA